MLLSYYTFKYLTMPNEMKGAMRDHSFARDHVFIGKYTLIWGLEREEHLLICVVGDKTGEKDVGRRRTPTAHGLESPPRGWVVRHFG